MCSGCDLGKYGSAPSVCSDCHVPNTYVDLRGTIEKCDTCPVGKVANEKRSGCELPSWGACKATEYLNDTDQDQSKWLCVTCPEGADCRTIDPLPRWSTLHHQDNYWNIPNGKDTTPFMKCPRPNTCLSSHHNVSTNCTSGQMKRFDKPIHNFLLPGREDT